VKQLEPNPGANEAESAGHAQGPSRLVGDDNAASWPAVPSAIRDGGALPGPWEALFEPIRGGMVDELVVIGQFGQSLDGRVATETGHSHYINGVDGLAHLHRLRAVVDAVVVGIGTALADDPQLTVRRVAGPNPARVVIDPHGRLPATARLWAADGARRLVVTAEGSSPALPDDIERLALPAHNGAIAPSAILARLAACGFRRILIEGGANTVSRFLVAGCLDRLHVVVAPMILGTGKPSFTLPPIDRVDRALRPPMRTHLLGDEVLFDCDLSAQRLPVGAAKKST
jgi:diaminohydroxyphosphoribosylaminopyrimidine deaminase/5-amino-6-(5-phosphoribosylamino)uracil reductase